MEIYDLIDPRVVTAFARTLPEDPNYTLNGVLPDREIPDIQFAIDDITSINRAAHFRAYDAPVEIGKGPQMVRTTGEIPAIGEGYLVGEYARLLQEQLRGSDISDEMLRLVLARAQRGVAAIRARMEVARGQVLATGKFELSGEGGLVLEADFAVPDTNFVAPALDWSNPSANIVADLTNWADVGEAASGIRPDSMIGGRVATAQAMQNTGLRNLYGNSFGAAQQLTMTQVNQVLAAQDLPTFALREDGRPVRPAKVTTVATNGTETVVDTFPTGAIAMFPAGQVGETLWGPTFEALELAATGQIEAQEAPGIIAMAMREGNPGKVFTVVNATGLPVLNKPAALVIGSNDAP